MVEKLKSIWADGKLIPWEQANVHVLAHGLHYGFGVFEGIRAYRDDQGRGQVFRLREHLRRLSDSAKICRFELPFPQETLFEACRALLRDNGLQEGYIRPIAFYGEGKMGLGAFTNPVRVFVACWEWGAYLGEEGIKNGIRAKISSFCRIHPNANMARAKVCGQYVNSILAKREALDGGYQEAILLDQRGYVAEASGENLFLVKDGRLVTPSRSSPILAGITRDSIITLARDLGYTVKEGTFTRDELYIADEVFLTGTAAEITPIREIDDRKIGEGKPGPVTKKLQTSYQDVVHGRTPKYAEWLTPVG